MTERDHIDTSPRQIRKFGLLFGVIGLLLAAYLAYKGSELWPWILAAAFFFSGAGLAFTGVLRPIYWAWMKFAFALGWINARILLTIFFYCVLTPIGLIIRAVGRDLLERKIDQESESYWIRREQVPFDPRTYERLF